MNKQFLMGLYMAPSVVCASVKTAILTSYVLEQLGYEVEPKYHEERADIVQNIIFHKKKSVIGLFWHDLQLVLLVPSLSLLLPPHCVASSGVGHHLICERLRFVLH